MTIFDSVSNPSDTLTRLPKVPFQFMGDCELNQRITMIRKALYPQALWHQRGKPVSTCLAWLKCFLASLIVLAALVHSTAIAQNALPPLASYPQYSALSIDAIIRQAVAGDVLAQHDLGSRLASGNGVPQNLSAAASWYSLAARRGFPGSPSLDGLPNFPIRASAESDNTNTTAPVARLSVTPESGSLLATVDASASSGASGNIARYIWQVTALSGIDAGVTISNTASAQISLPEPGSYYVTASVLDTTGQIGYVTELLEIAAPPEPELPNTPELSSPVAAQSISVNETVDFQWIQAPDATRYQFQLLRLSNAAEDPLVAAEVPIASCENALCSVSVTFDFAEYGTLSWRTRAINETGPSAWASAEINALAPIPADSINISPAPGANLNQGDIVSFVWQNDPIADSYEFHIYNQSNKPELFNYVVGLLPADICVDDVCTLPVALDIPVNINHAWRVRARNASGVSVWSRSIFNIIEPITELADAPVLLAPVNGGYVETGSPVTFSWTPVALATRYELEIPDATALVSDSMDASSCLSQVCSLTVDLSIPADAEYTWRVRSVNPVGASDWTDTRIYAINAAEVAPAVPTHISPADGADLVENALATFTWVHDPIVTVYDFHLFNNEPGDDRGALPFVLDLNPRDICSNGLCAYETLVNLPLYTDHAWRVRAGNSRGKSFWSRSTFNAVVLVTDPPPAPVALSPAANAVLETDTSVTFSWNAATTASRYQWQLLDTENTALDAPTAFVPAANCLADTCSVSVALDLPVGTTYQWQVRAENAAGNSDWVTTDIQIIARATTRPPMPTQLSPEPLALLSQNSSTDFVWTRDVHAVTYEFYFYDIVLGDGRPVIDGLSADDICDEAQCTLAVPVELPVSGNHFWRVRGRNSLGASPWASSIIEVIETITDPPGGFELTSPLANTEILEGTEVNFLWTRAANATTFELALIDGTDPEAEPQVFPLNASTCDVDFCNYTTTPQLPLSDQHVWQVRGINALGETDWVSASFALVPEPVELLDAPIIVAPTAGTPVMADQPVVFQWQQNTDAQTYEFYLTDALTGALPVVDNLLPADYCVDSLCSYSTAIDLQPGDQHSWYVRARHADADSAWAVTALSVASDADLPVASFTVDGVDEDATGVAPVTLAFDPAPSSDNSVIVQYAWDFGDGSAGQITESADTVTHTYTTAGTYTVTLTVTNDTELTAISSRNITVLDPATTISSAEASRLLAQATFGPTRSDILEVQTLGIEAWLDNQFTLQGPPHLDYVAIYSNDSNRAPRHEVWWSDVVRGDDQLRQRVAFALSQILVVSDVGDTLSKSQYGIANYYDLLRENAFGNYRELLEQVTLSPVMGQYLSMLQNAKGDPASSTRADENFAREVLQLFSVGLHELNIDGSTTTSPIPTPVFDQDQIEAFARVFTGWNYADAGVWNRVPYSGADMISPMRPFESFHDTGAKQLLTYPNAAGGGAAPAGLLARQDLEFALDNIFNHPNVGPFISSQLIKRLVTSNPSPGYIQRVATVFNDDGSGVRGNLQAVVRALLLDSEARTNTSSAAYGKLREPVLRLSHLWRAFNVQPGTQSVRQEFNTVSPALMNLPQVTGQAVLSSPSVFNFFQPNFSPAGPVASQNLVAPEFELFTESNELATSNRIGRQIQDAYLGNPQSNGRTTSYLDFTYELTLAADPDALIDHLDVLLLSGNLTAPFRSLLINHLDELPLTDEGLSQRVRDAATLIMASPDYLVQM